MRNAAPSYWQPPKKTANCQDEWGSIFAYDHDHQNKLDAVESTPLFIISVETQLTFKRQWLSLPPRDMDIYISTCLEHVMNFCRLRACQERSKQRSLRTKNTARLAQITPGISRPQGLFTSSRFRQKHP